MRWGFSFEKGHNYFLVVSSYYVKHASYSWEYVAAFLQGGVGLIRFCSFVPLVAPMARLEKTQEALVVNRRNHKEGVWCACSQSLRSLHRRKNVVTVGRP